jgi:hypothetical protein
LEVGEMGNHKAKTRVVTLNKFAEEQGWFIVKTLALQ